MSIPVYADALDALWRTIKGEAASEPWEGKVAVAHVVLNRVKRPDAWWGKDIEGVCHFPGLDEDKWHQFSCWNFGDPNRMRIIEAKLEDGTSNRECLAAAAAAIWGLEEDPTDGCWHYMTKARRAQGWPNSWGPEKEPHREIGVHFFYKGIP